MPLPSKVAINALTAEYEGGSGKASITSFADAFPNRYKMSMICRSRRDICPCSKRFIHTHSHNAKNTAIKKMLNFQHQRLTSGSNCCFFSITMTKHPAFLPLALLLGLASALLISSCSAPSGHPTNPPSTQAGASESPRNSAYRAAEASSIPKERPGLGTGWGDSVDSAISYTQFQRGSHQPTGTDVIYYNDKEGIEAMTHSRKYSGKGMQSAANGLVEWGVKGKWGYLKNYHARYDTHNRRYVQGKKNSNYALVVKNLCRSRLEIVLSVDGLDVSDGKAAAYKKRGYIVQPGKTLVVDGFRTSEQAVAAFRFSSVSSSYSNQRHGQTRNVGVIGLAVFTEKGIDPWTWSNHAVRQRHGASPFAEAPHPR